MRLKILFGLLISLAFVGCSKAPKVSIEIPELKEGNIAIIYASPDQMQNPEQSVIYTSDYKDGKIEIKLDSIKFDKDLIECALIVRSKDNSKFINLPLPLEKGKTLEVKITNLSQYDKGGIVKVSYEGSKHAEEFNTFWNKIQNLKIEEVNANAQTINDVFKKFANVYKEYIDNYPESGFPYMLLMSQLSSMPFDNNNALFALSDKLCTDTKGNNWKDVFCKLIGEKKLAAATSTKLVFSAVDEKGNAFTERDVQGRLILVDFWASWCKPCQEEMPHLKDIYNKYSSKGLSIVGISIDKNESDWKAFLAKNPLPWLSLIGEGESLTKRYDFEYIPFNLLVDESGNILAKNIHGKELDSFIEKHFSNK